MNKTILMGRLVRSPEGKTTANGIATCRFTMAVDRRYKKDGEERQADFINCVAWRGTAEFVCRYFQKGNRILLVGSIQTRSWEKDGEKHYATEVQVDEVEFVDARKNDVEPERQAEPETHTDDPNDDCALPFDL
jgi:single-strand DNA-binding protein